MNHAETLKAVLQDLINDRAEQASVTMHEYFVAKTQEISGLSEAKEPSAIAQVHALAKAGGLLPTEGVVAAAKATDRLYYVVSKDPDEPGQYIVNAFHVSKDGKKGDFAGAPMGEFENKAAAVKEMNALVDKKKVSESLNEGFKLYTEDPYGNGFVKKPVKKGEVLPTEDGEHVEFCRVTDDGKKVVVMVDGEEKEMSLKKLGGKTLPADEKPSGKGWV